MSKPSYRIYPSLLDKFQKFLDSDLVAEEYWNKTPEGDYKLTHEKMSEQLEKELLDTVNRAPRTSSEAADKGTAFNEVVDYILMHHTTERDDMQIVSRKDEGDIQVDFNNLHFSFDANLCRSLATYFEGHIPQYTCSAILPTAYGNVELYGHIDYVGTSRVCDLKTTKDYKFGNYEKYWQRFVYPYCLIESGDLEMVEEFEFTVVEWKERKNKPITGEMYKEVYTYSHKAAKARLTTICESLIEWLEMHRDVITDKKIFGGERE